MVGLTRITIDPRPGPMTACTEAEFSSAPRCHNNRTVVLSFLKIDTRKKKLQVRHFIKANNADTIMPIHKR